MQTAPGQQPEATVDHPHLGAADLLLQAERATALGARLRAAISSRIVGQQGPIDELLAALLAGGHALLVGAPGLAKTLMVRTLAALLAVPFRRIQFTPDLMPADIIGSEMMATSARGEVTLRFAPGPLFANLVLADEVNRTPPKTQAALLECMQEGAVTVGGQLHRLPRPFHVFATQNPLEQEGTYPLPEAQLDRFMVHIALDYPDAAAELAMARTGGGQPPLQDGPAGAGGGTLSGHPSPGAIDAEQLLAAQAVVPKVPIPEPLLQAAVQLVRATRPQGPEAPAAVRQALAFGAGPRAVLHLLRVSQARALLGGKQAVTADDLRALAAPVLRHRLLLGSDGLLTAGGDPAAMVDGLIDQLLPDVLRG